MISCSPSTIARRSILTLYEFPSSEDHAKARRNTEVKTVAVLNALKDPAPRLETSPDPSMLTCGGCSFTMEPAGSLNQDSIRLLCNLGDAIGITVTTGVLPAESVFRSMPSEPARAVAMVSAMVRAAAAVLVRIQNGNVSDREDPTWDLSLKDCCTAIGLSIDPASPDMVRLDARTPFAPLLIKSSGRIGGGVETTSDEWDSVVPPASRIYMTHDQGMSGIEFYSVRAVSPSLDAMETFRAMARIQDMRDAPWWP